MLKLIILSYKKYYRSYFLIDTFNRLFILFKLRFFTFFTHVIRNFRNTGRPRPLQPTFFQLLAVLHDYRLFVFDRSELSDETLKKTVEDKDYKVTDIQ